MSLTSPAIGVRPKIAMAWLPPSRMETKQWGAFEIEADSWSRIVPIGRL
jgi:hypothetical protein